MAYPADIDSFTTVDNDTPTADVHADLENDQSTAIVAVETELGANPSGSYATVADRLAAAGGDVPEYIGDWSAAVAYKDGDIVMYGGVPYMAVDPSTNVPPVPWAVAGGGIQGPPGVVSPFRYGHTWALVGDIIAATLPVMFVPKNGTQNVTLVGTRAKIGGGTSITAQVQRNGSNLGSPITVTPTAATTAFSQALADQDEIRVVLSAPVGSPTDLSFTLLLEHTP